MKFLLTTWPGRAVSLFALTLFMAIGGYLIDPAYFQNPIGEGEIGLVAADGYSLPATSEIEVLVDGVDPLQIDLKSTSGDFSGTVEVIAPNGSMLFTDQFALRFYEKSFLPNHAKWQTFYSSTPQKGTYLLRLTQKEYGKAKIFFYQGPFLFRMLMLPLVAGFFLLVVIFTLSPAPEKNNAET